MLESKRKMSINQIIFLGFGLVFGIMIAIAVILQQSSKTTTENMLWVTHTYKVKTNLNRFLAALVDGETGQRGFIFTNKEEFLEPYNSAKDRYRGELASLKELVSDNPKQVKRLDGIEQLASKKFSELLETIQLKKANKDEELMNLVVGGAGKQYMDAIRAALDEIEAEEDQLLKERLVEMEKSTSFLTLLSIGGTSVAIFIGIVVARIIAIKIMRPIEDSVRKIATTSTQITTTISELTRVASQQAVSVNETNTTMEELGSSSRQSAEQANSAAHESQKAMSLSQQGLEQVEETLCSIQEAKEKVASIAQQILILSEQTNNIRDITDLVSDFANETKMLAMNAAVEAVRAGEHGKGFSVLAVETRKLADESKRSAGRIGNLVGEIQKITNTTVIATEDGTKTVDHGMNITRTTADTFKNVSEAVHVASEGSQQISMNVQQQSIAIKQVVEAMRVLNTAAKETASGVSQINIGIKTLNETAKQLQAMI